MINFAGKTIHERDPLTEEQFRELYRTASMSREVIEGFGGRSRAAIYLLAYATRTSAE